MNPLDFFSAKIILRTKTIKSSIELPQQRIFVSRDCHFVSKPLKRIYLASYRHDLHVIWNYFCHFAIKCIESPIKYRFSAYLQKEKLLRIWSIKIVRCFKDKMLGWKRIICNPRPTFLKLNKILKFVPNTNLTHGVQNTHIRRSFQTEIWEYLKNSALSGFYCSKLWSAIVQRFKLLTSLYT